MGNEWQIHEVNLKCEKVYIFWEKEGLLGSRGADEKQRTLTFLWDVVREMNIVKEN